MLAVNESGLYALITQSRKPEAVEFQRWVTATLTTFNVPAEIAKGSFIRSIIGPDGEPWFVAKDVCDALGLDHVKNATRTLGDHEVRTVTRSTNRNLFTLGRGSSRLILISESGLYALVMQSRKPEAQAFRQWVTGTVLPSIRKNGGYIAGQEGLKDGTMSDIEFLARAQEVAQRVLTQVQAERDAASARANKAARVPRGGSAWLSKVAINQET